LIDSPSLDTWRTLHAQQAVAAISAVNAVLAATQHAETAIRERAVQTLGVMRQPAAVDRLSALLTNDPAGPEDAIWPRRYLVAHRLAEMREQQAVAMRRELGDAHKTALVTAP
jgi:hypothetical protein